MNYKNQQEIIYKTKGSGKSLSYLYLIMGGMIGSSALTIIVVKTIKCLQKREDQAKVVPT